MKKIFVLFIALAISSLVTAQNSFKMSSDFIIKSNAKDGSIELSECIIECDKLVIDSNVKQINLTGDVHIICNSVDSVNFNYKKIIKINSVNPKNRYNRTYELIFDTKDGKIYGQIQIEVNSKNKAKFTLTSPKSK